jgi:peptidoglycan hydrolase-like protein with peptidoglycan-binding domain
MKQARRGVRIGTGLAAVAASAGVLASGAPVAAAAIPQALLTEGSSGAAVAKIQRALHLKRTGRFTAGTRHAVLAFQHSHHLIVDGIVGPQTEDALFGIKPPSVAPAAGSVGGYSIPASIVECESGGNYAAVNPESGAGGAYQILPSTWAAYGGQGLPENASPAEQNAIAARIYAADGPSAWSC